MFSFVNLIKINGFMTAILKVAYLNLLWLLSSCLGLVLFSTGPATYAMMKYYDRWLRFEEDLPVARTFWKYFKERYRQSVLVSWVYLALAAILVVNLFNVTQWYLQVANLLIFLVTVLSATYVYTVMATMTFTSVKEILQASLLLGFGSLHYTIILWTVLLGAYYLVSVIMPSLLLFFGIGFSGMAISYTGKKIMKNLKGTPTAEDEEERDREKFQNTYMLKGELK